MSLHYECLKKEENIMGSFRVIGKSLPRKDGPDKVHGRVRFTDDEHSPGMLYAAMLTSPHTHAKIISIDRSH